MDRTIRTIKPKLSLLKLADKLGSVTRACETLGYSRDSYYRFKALYERGGMNALKDVSRRKPVLKNRVPVQVETSVIAMTFAHPSWGQQRLQEELTKNGISVSPSGVRSIWVRAGLETFEKRIFALLARVQQDGFPLSPEQLAAVERAKRDGKFKPGRYIALPGQVAYQDLILVEDHSEIGTFAILTFVDGYSHHAFAQALPSLADVNASAFLETRVLPWYAERHITIKSIRTDRRMPFIDAGRGGYKDRVRLRGIDHGYRLTRARARPDAGAEFVTEITRSVLQPLFRSADCRNIFDVERKLESWLHEYNSLTPRLGASCYGKTPEKTLQDASRFVPGRFKF